MTRIIDIKTLRPRQNGGHFAENSWKFVLLTDNEIISIKISFKIVPKVPINNIWALGQIWLGVDQVPSRYLQQWWLDYRRIIPFPDLNELTHKYPIKNVMLGNLCYLNYNSSSTWKMKNCFNNCLDKIHVFVCGVLLRFILFDTLNVGHQGPGKNPVDDVNQIRPATVWTHVVPVSMVCEVLFWHHIPW